ncbi:zinc sigma-54-dependent two-component system response regulator [Desulfocucumis palustris]|uniref:HTH-type transcriptional regulatory protein TyrR n=1 Tax=Desulfocucumis palustris TaxID=1898651 RepID=A0A2L2XG84_9FIRM|nr:sigma-54-dependent Fis family transcriptional regulator [Desulfocucumis palustris]GBF35258.1 zinc sigma-54-dependent two-component system response regulator [Desulfocucumis palustris]
MLVSKLMIKTAITIAMDSPLLEAWKMMMDSNIMGIPVTGGNDGIAGMITREDIISAGPDCVNPSFTVGQAMEKNVAVITENTPLVEAWMLPGRVFPVVNDEGRLTGILDKNAVSPELFNMASYMQQQLEAILDSAHNGIIAIDKTGKVTIFNSAAEKITRRSKSWALGKHLSQVIIPQDLLDVLKEGKTQRHVKFSVHYSTGSHIYLTNRNPIIENGETVGAVAVFQDISEIEFISEELNSVKHLNKELEGIIESSYDGIVITDRSGNITKSNGAFKKTFGMDTDSSGVKDAFSPGIIETVLQQGEAVTQVEKTPSGNHILVTANPVRNDHNEIFRVVVNVRDLTELNHLRQELEQSKKLSEQYQKELSQLRQKHFKQTGLVFSSPKMQELLKTALRLSQVDSTVLLLGESGVGKEVIATTIHSQSHRKEGPFIAVNCGAIPADLLESELFGYEKGAFTGANREGKSGMFELANGGTLFLDEIGDLPKDFQVKLLRAIQEREIMRVGGNKPRPINVRIIAATNHDLENLVREGKFREDLYFRLNVVPLDIPPLRERKEDIIPLIYSFKNKFSKAYEINKDIAPEVYDILLQYQWPGNVRELENVIERLMVTTNGDTIGVNDIPPHLINYTPDNHPEIKVQGIIPLKEAVNTVERQLISNALKQFGSTYKAARVLQVDQSTIVRKANKLNIYHKDT